jgi:thiosulfate dehydrogenase [quinone] large subunit
MLLARADQMAVDESLPFTDPASGDPGILIRLASGFVAYSAVCTHEGCTVAYRSSSHLLACPCHSAAFNPAQQGAVVRGPARRPLTILPITLAPNGNVYLNS